MAEGKEGAAKAMAAEKEGVAVEVKEAVGGKEGALGVAATEWRGVAVGSRARTAWS